LAAEKEFNAKRRELEELPEKLVATFPCRRTNREIVVVKKVMLAERNNELHIEIQLGYREENWKQIDEKDEAMTHDGLTNIHKKRSREKRSVTMMNVIRQNKSEIKMTSKEASAGATNITWHDQKVTRESRWKLSGHSGAVLWFTGLSGAGKSTVANQVDSILNAKGIRTYLLDGDNIRHGLCKDLGFSLEDRAENIRRVGEVCKLMADSGILVLAALISPYRADRKNVRTTVEMVAPFVEVHVQASVSTCEGRDPKGLYKMAREGKIKNFTGIDDPYEEPENPEIILDSNSKDVSELVNQTVSWIEDKIVQ
jgi:adenylylsulfate kinase